MNERQATTEQPFSETQSAGLGTTTSGTLDAAAGGLTGWGIRMAGGAFIGLVADMFLGLAIAKASRR